MPSLIEQDFNQIELSSEILIFISIHSIWAVFFFFFTNLKSNKTTNSRSPYFTKQNSSKIIKCRIAIIISLWELLISRPFDLIIPQWSGCDSWVPGSSHTDETLAHLWVPSVLNPPIPFYHCFGARCADCHSRAYLKLALTSDSWENAAGSPIEQNIAFNFLGKIAGAACIPAVPGPNILLLSGKRVLSRANQHAGFENRNDVIAWNRPTTRSDLLAALLPFVVVERRIFFPLAKDEIENREETRTLRDPFFSHSDSRKYF